MKRKIQDSPNTNWFFANKKSDSFKKVIKTFMGRDALIFLLKNITIKKNQKVLIPAYICNEVITVFKNFNYEIVYYDINEDFSLNQKKIKQLLNVQNFSVFYFVIYFGIGRNKLELFLEKIKLQNPSLFIIEDRAHYLSEKYNFNQSDAFLFSFRKLLPIPEGGGILTKKNFSIKYKNKFKANILPFLMILKKRIFGHNPKYSRNKLSHSNSFLQDIMPISLLSKNVIYRFNYTKDIELRRSLFYSWKKLIDSTNFKPLFSCLSESDIPQGFPIFVDNAEKLQYFMKKQGYYLKRHWKLKDEIRYVAPVSYNLSKTIITLPIYNGITIKDQRKIINSLIKYSKQ